MSHHINFDFTLNDERKESPKLQKSKEKTSAKKRESKKLEIDNQVMEWRLNQLKATMEKEKEERSKQSYIWKSSNDEALNAYSRNILGRSVKQPSKIQQKSTSRKAKVTVLTDEPLEIPKRKSHSQDLINKLMKPTPPKRKSPMHVKEVNNSETVSHESWISISMDRFSEEVIEIQSDINGNLPLSSLHGINSSAIGLYFMRYGRKRLLMAVDNKIMKPKSGWGTEIYFPYMASVSPHKEAIEPTPPPLPSSRSISNKTAKGNSLNVSAPQGRLLNGTFDEEENAISFQKALMEWRSGTTQKTENTEMKHSVETAVHGVQSDPVSVDITFSETSTLTFMEKLLIKKHRETEVPPMPNGLEQSEEDFAALEDTCFTAEELEERERFRELFSTHPTQNLSGSPTTTEFSEQTCNISEVEESDVQINNWMENDNVCFVEEASDDESMTNSVTEETNQFEEDSMSSLLHVAEPKSIEVNVKQESEIDDNRIFFVPKPMQEVSNLESLPPSYNDTQNVNDNLNVVSYQKDEDESENMTNNSTEDFNTLVSAISNIPLNPDAVYQRGLNDFTSEISSERSELQKILDQSPSNIMLCNSHNQVMWSIDQTNDNSVNLIATDTPDDSVPREFTDEAAEQEIEDEQTLNKLEWELASRTGNITSDGRISRLIDEWSSEEDLELGITNDPGCGSGLSTLEVDATSFVGTAMSSYSDDQIQKDFQQMEAMMIGSYDTESERDDSDYSP